MESTLEFNSPKTRSLVIELVGCFAIVKGLPLN